MRSDDLNRDCEADNGSRSLSGSAVRRRVVIAWNESHFVLQSWRWVWIEICDLLWRVDCNTMKRVRISETSHRLQQISGAEYFLFEFLSIFCDFCSCNCPKTIFWQFLLNSWWVYDPISSDFRPISPVLQTWESNPPAYFISVRILDVVQFLISLRSFSNLNDRKPLSEARVIIFRCVVDCSSPLLADRASKTQFQVESSRSKEQASFTISSRSFWMIKTFCSSRISHKVHRISPQFLNSIVG